MTTKTPKPRRFRRHQDAPASWRWRHGRPCWIPSQGLRKAGWKSCVMLKDEQGGWLSDGASRDRATAINRAVADWREGRPVPKAMADIAPPGAATIEGAGAGRAASPTADRLSLGRLRDAWLASDEFGKLAPKTQHDYRNKFGRLIDTLAGWAELPDRDDAEGEARRKADHAAQLRESVFILQPRQTDTGVIHLLRTAYWTLKRTSGDNQASGVMAVVSVFLGWVREHQNMTVSNWAKEVSRETPTGRIRILTWPEIKALIETADQMGLPSIADAVILALDTGWSQADVLGLTWERVAGDRVHLGAGRAKTGRKGGWRLMPRLGLARLPLIRSRQQHMKPMPRYVIAANRKKNRAAAPEGGRFTDTLFRQQFAAVRAEAAKACAALLGDPNAEQPIPSATFADLRDTAWSWGRNAGFTDDMTAGRHAQSRTTVRALGDNNYGEIGPEITDEASRRMDDWLGKMGFGL